MTTHRIPFLHILFRLPLRLPLCLPLCLLLCLPLCLLLCLQLCGTALAQSVSAPVISPVAAAGQAPVLIPGALKFQTSVGNFNQSITKTNGSLGGLVRSFGKLVAIGQAYPAAVSQMKAGAGLPANPTGIQEAQAYTKVYLENSGVQPKQAQAISGAVGGIEAQARKFNVLDPTSIMMMVGIAAGTNIVSQVVQSGTLDLKSSLGFVADKKFWGGVVGSSAAYSAAGYALTALLPGGGGVVRALLPTFGAMAAGLVGWDLGSNGFGTGFKEAFSNISWTGVIGQAAGSTIGMFMGPQLLAGFGPWGASIGALVGAMVLGSLGRRLAEGFVDKAQNDPVGLIKDGVGLVSLGAGGLGGLEGLDVASDLAAGTLAPGVLSDDATSSLLRQRFDSAYKSFLDAEKRGDAGASNQAFSRMTMLKSSMEAMHRSRAAASSTLHTAPR